MDGMMVRYHSVSTAGRGETVISSTINWPRPAPVIAEISLCIFDTASASFGTPITVGVFVPCITDGSNPRSHPMKRSLFWVALFPAPLGRW